MSAALDGLAQAVTASSGIQIGKHRARALRSALDKAAPGMNDTAVLDVLTDPERLRGLVEQVIDELTVQETFFMREADPLRGLDWDGMLRRARARGHAGVRVWSAACATGEEAYTLAMLAVEALGPSAPVSVLATDIARPALAVARRGWYRGRPLQHLDPALVGRHMLEEDGGFLVAPAVRDLVHFRRHSLARDPAPPLAEEPFDLILCRNVLIYLDADAAARVVTALQKALRPGGALLLGVADRLCVPRELRVPAAGTKHAPASRAHDRPRPVTREDRRLRPLVPAPVEPEPRASVLREALAAADAGRLDAAITGADRALAVDPLNPAAFYVRATAELAHGDAAAAVRSLRSALYVDPLFGLAAFKLGRSYEELGDRGSAHRAYRQALRALDSEQAIQRDLLGHANVSEIATACAMRVHELTDAPSGKPRAVPPPQADALRGGQPRSRA